MVSEPPVVGLVSGQTGTVDTRLLTGTKTDDGSVESVAYRVGLGVLEGKRGDNEISDGLLGQLGGAI